MAEKAKVSREVAEFLKSCENSGVMYWEDDLLVEHTASFVGNHVAIKDEARCLCKYSPIELAKILINGYEIEQTPEEKLVERFQYCEQRWGWHQDDETEMRATANAIKETLNTLGIKIKGINE